MACAVISLLGKNELCFVYSTMNSKHYTDVLQNQLLSFTYYNFGSQIKPFLFMQDIAPFYSSSHTKICLKKCEINVVEQPALSSDCSPIESIWGALAKSAYSAGKLYCSVEEPKGEIEPQWSLNAPTIICNCTSSMLQICRAFIHSNCSKISY